MSPDLESRALLSHTSTCLASMTFSGDASENGPLHPVLSVSRSEEASEAPTRERGAQTRATQLSAGS